MHYACPTTHALVYCHCTFFFLEKINDGAVWLTPPRALTADAPCVMHQVSGVPHDAAGDLSRLQVGDVLIGVNGGFLFESS